jgi:teichuronic acid biosynthesis glycosyltransferase TuaG
MKNSNDNNAPLVSVIMPTYNHADFLKKSLSSVLNQTFSDWEAIVVNNFSTDNTIEIIESFSDPRIKLINYNNNGAIASSRNQGIIKARGTYIAFLDSDDSWYPHKLEASLKHFQKTDLDLVCNSELLVENDTPIATWHHGPLGHFSYDKLLIGGNCLSTSAIVVKRQRLIDAGNFNPDIKYNTAEDYDLWLRLAKAGCKFKFIREILGDHLKHANNQSSAVIKHFNANRKVAQTHFDNLNQTFVLALKKRRCYAIQFYGTARQAAQQNLFSLSSEFFFKSLTYNPLRIKTYVGVLLLCVRYIKAKF